MNGTLEAALSQAIQSWLLNNEPTPTAKRLAQSLNKTEMGRSAGASLEALITSLDIEVDAILIHNFIHILSERVHTCLSEMAKGDAHADQASS